jgi:nicotinamidase-related amidase
VCESAKFEDGILTTESVTELLSQLADVARFEDLPRVKAPITIRRGTVAATFIDLQEEHRRDRRYLVDGFGAVLANARKLQQAARANGAPLYHWAYIVDLETQARPFHPLDAAGRSVFSDKSDPLTAICAEVAPLDGERMLVKAEASALRDGTVVRDLKELGIEWLVVAGVWTEACVDATVRDAVALGFRVLLVKDACGSGSAAMHQTAILNLANRLYGGAVADTEAVCRMLAGESVEAWQVEGAVPLRYTYENAAALYDEL